METVTANVQAGCQKYEGYNARIREAVKRRNLMRCKNWFDLEPANLFMAKSSFFDLTELPYIVIVVDEFADLMLVAGKMLKMPSMTGQNGTTPVYT